MPALTSHIRNFLRYNGPGARDRADLILQSIPNDDDAVGT